MDGVGVGDGIKYHSSPTFEAVLIGYDKALFLGIHHEVIESGEYIGEEAYVDDLGIG